MGTIYSGTTDPDVVNKRVITVEEINLQEYVDKYLALKAQYQALPETKLTPDEETLVYYNSVIISQNEIEIITLKNTAQELYNELKPIKDVGLLPTKYDNEFQQLENFINNG